ncbi:MAG TPA: 16S rRNA (guanine(966)-N(2))-methyltransferase RsmD [Caulobacteraceae bacterium]|jgi:16S rRNA (guanine966-N2)-methyltransferase
MRIVAGAYRGRPLVAPKGHSTRPTADRTRQALFNVLEHAPWAPAFRGARILDLFAGAGALGLEALSRGAAFCLFVDRDAAARAAIEANLLSLGCGSAGEVSQRDASAPGALGPRPRFEFAFLDPPYGQGLAEAALGALTAGGWLAPGAVAIVERRADEAPLTAPGFRRLDERRWGVARVEFLAV